MRFLPALVLVLATAAACKKADDKQPPAATPPAAGTAAPAATTPPPAPGATAPADKPVEGAVAIDATTLKIAAVPNKVGDKRTKTDDIEVIFTIEAGGKKVDVVSKEHKQEAVEVLAVDGAGARTKQKVTYSGLKMTQTIEGKSKDKPQVLDGKSYLVWIEGGAVKATTADGAAVSDAELAELVKSNRELGRPDEMDSIIGRRAWKIGETYAFTADDLAKLNARSAGSDRPVALEMSLTLDRFDAATAQFTMASKLKQQQGSDTLEFTMKGPVTLELPAGRATAMEMIGAIVGTAKGMPAAGTMKNRTTYTY